jgi:hypothetical protein
MSETTKRANSLRRQPAFRRCVRWLACLTAGGMLLQTATTTSCGQNLSDLAGALGNPVATGIGIGLSNLAQALVISVFV